MRAMCIYIYIHTHIFTKKETKCMREKGSRRLVEPIQAFVYAPLKRRDVRAESKKRANKHTRYIFPFECCSLQKSNLPPTDCR